MKHILGNTYVLEGSTNTGIYIENDNVYLIDAGGSKKILREAVESFYGKEITLLITHHHSDHIKNAAYLQKTTGCEVLAPTGELSMVAKPILESYILFGANPPKSLRGDFFVSKPVNVKPLRENIPLKVIDLPGHTPFHVGYMTPDGVIFSGDLFFAREILKKYSYPYHTSISILRETLKKFEKMSYEIVVPAHGKESKDPSQDISFMIEAIEKFEREVLDILNKPMVLEEIAIEISRKFDLKFPKGFWYLFRSFVAATLEDLERSGEIYENSGIWGVKE